jgi:hypothetical protein
MMAQSDLQALIAETKALGWDKPDHLVAHDGVLAPKMVLHLLGSC